MKEEGKKVWEKSKTPKSAGSAAPTCEWHPALSSPFPFVQTFFSHLGPRLCLCRHCSGLPVATLPLDAAGSCLELLSELSLTTPSKSMMALEAQVSPLQGHEEDTSPFTDIRQLSLMLPHTVGAETYWALAICQAPFYSPHMDRLIGTAQ